MSEERISAPQKPSDPLSPWIAGATSIVGFVVVTILLTAALIGFRGETWSEETAIPKLVAFYDLGMMGIMAVIWYMNRSVQPEKKTEWIYYFIGVTFATLPWIGFERIDEIKLIAPFLLIGMSGLVVEVLDLYRKPKPKT